MKNKKKIFDTLFTSLGFPAGAEQNHKLYIEGASTHSVNVGRVT